LITESQEFARCTGREKVESIIGTSMSEDDIRAFLAWPHSNFCTDGDPTGLHPRAYGAFPRIFARYSRSQHLFSLVEAVRKATSLAAAHVGIHYRGRIAPGYFADLVLFDPARIADTSTTEQPHRLATGIDTVWVNGVEVFSGGCPTGARPGQVLRHQPN
jgi:N-acyl-D-amino-acid deacylase